MTVHYFRRGRLYRHKNNQDVAFETIKSFYIPEKQVYSLKVQWWNVGRVHLPWFMGIEQRISIPQAAIKDWGVMGFQDKVPA